MSHNPFSPNYKSQLDLSDITRERKLSESRSASLEKRRQSDDPEVRRQAEGTILGLSKKADKLRVEAEALYEKADKKLAKAGKKALQSIGQWPKKKPLNQPPINSQAKLQSDPPGKSAKLSRGRAI